MQECFHLAVWISSQRCEIRLNTSARQKRGCSVHLFSQLNNSTQPGNFSRSSILCIRHASLRLVLRLPTLMSFLTRWMTRPSSPPETADENWGEQPPFWPVRLFVEKSRKDRQEPHRGIEPLVRPFSL